MKPVHQILVEPYITEKTSEFMLNEAEGSYKYAFKVAVDANKIEIRKAVEERFSVEVTAVKTVIVRGKIKRMRFAAGQRPKWKKAFVTLKPGQSIKEFEGA